MELRYHEACPSGFQSPARHLHSLRANPDARANFERLLAMGRTGTLLHFSLGSKYLNIAASSPGASRLVRAATLGPEFSAAWTRSGRAPTECGRVEATLSAYERGISVAELKGVKQAAKEMAMFPKRIVRQRGSRA